MRRSTLLPTVVCLVALMPGTAVAGHDVPPGDGLVEFPFPLTCDGITAIITVTPGELRSAGSLGPGWATELGMAIPRSLTFLDNGEALFVLTNGKKTAKGLESSTCTGTAVLDGEPVRAVFEVVLLP